MTETPQTTQGTEPAKAEVPKLTFEEYLEKSTFPEAALQPIVDKVQERNKLVRQVNEWIAQVNAAKAQDPSNVEYLDSLWRDKAESNHELVSEKAEEFFAVAEQYEKLLAELRKTARENFIPEQLSPEKAQETRQKVNAATPTIAEATKTIAGQLTLVESMLNTLQVPIPEGGIVSLLPQANSLKNTRTRKGATEEDSRIGKYMTRVYDVLIDGESTQVKGKGKFNYAADKLSEKFGISVHPANEVTAEEIEEEYYKALGIERRLKDANLPLEFTFTFEKTIKKQNPNDNSFTDVPVPVKLTVQSEKYGKQLAEKAEAPKAEEPKAANVGETPKVETPKVEDVTSKVSTPAPAAKKTAAPAKK